MIARITSFIRNHPGRAGTIAGWFQQVCSGGSAIILVPLLLHYLGSGLAGVWFAFQGFLAFAQLSDFGFGLAISRQIAFTRSSSRRSARHDLLEFEPGWAGVAEIMGMSKRIYLFICGVASVGLIIVFEGILPQTEMRLAAAPYRLAWYLSGGAAIGALAAGWHGAILIGLGKTHWVRFTAGCYALVQGIGVAVVVLFGGGLTSMAVVSLAASAVYFLSMQIALHQFVMRPPSAHSGQPAPPTAALFRIAAPVGTVNVASFLVSAIQVPILASLLGPEKVAPFYLAQKIGQFLSRGAMQAIQPQLPFFTRLLADLQENRARLAMMRCILISAGLTGGAMLIFLATPWIISSLSSQKNFPNFPTVSLMALDYFLLGVTTSMAHFVLAAGRNPFVASTLAAGAINLVLTFAFVPAFGLIGLPLATLISGLATNYWLAPLASFNLLRSLGADSSR